MKNDNKNTTASRTNGNGTKEKVSPNKKKMVAKQTNKSDRYFIATRPDATRPGKRVPVTTTLRESKESSLKVLTQGSPDRWERYQKEGYKIEDAANVFARSN